jgi:hypothetical protein
MLEGKKLLGTIRRGFWDNIKVYFEEVRHEKVFRFSSVRCQVKKEINLSLIKRGKILYKLGYLLPM